MPTLCRVMLVVTFLSACTAPGATSPVPVGTTPVEASSDPPRIVARHLLWSELSAFDYVDGMVLPDEVTALDGAEVEIRGFLLRLEEDQYMVVEALWGQHHGHPPDLHEAVIVQSDIDAAHLERCPVTVVGRMSVGEEQEDGYIISLFRLRSSALHFDPEGAADPEALEACRDAARTGERTW